MSARAVILVAAAGAVGIAAYLALNRPAQAALLAPGAGGGDGAAPGAPGAVTDALAGAVGGFDGWGAALAQGVQDAAGQVAGVFDDAVFSVTGWRMSGARWLQAAAEPQHAEVAQLARMAEARHQIPADLFLRLLWQESRYDPKAYNAASGASGVAQIVPRWHPGVDPWDVAQAIDYGARYLVSLYRTFGSWELALKAYNWGQGNVRKWLDSGRVSPIEPTETRNYSAQILGDLAAEGRVIA